MSSQVTIDKAPGWDHLQVNVQFMNEIINGICDVFSRPPYYIINEEVNISKWYMAISNALSWPP